MVSACNCTWCQRRSGSVFSVASRWPLAQVVAREGEVRRFQRRGDSGGLATIAFCPTCSSTVWTELEAMPEVIGVPVGAFADPTFPPPQVVVWCDSKADWMTFPHGMIKLADQRRPVGPE